VQAIEQAVDRLRILVEAARRLDVAAADLMKAELHKVDLAALAAKMAEAYSRTYVGDRIIVKAAASEPIFVEATEESLETVIENLLDNAVGFSPKGGAVTLRVTAHSGLVTLIVEDEGPGVAPDKLPQIFQRNFSYRPHQVNSGEMLGHFGVGLAMVRRNIELLGGSVGAENIEGAGLRVTLQLPAA
jgi:two-component system sensor histidine kinase ChvG